MSETPDRVPRHLMVKPEETLAGTAEEANGVLMLVRELIGDENTPEYEAQDYDEYGRLWSIVFSAEDRLKEAGDYIEQARSTLSYTGVRRVEA